MAENYNVTIKRAAMNLVMPRSELITCTETSDGISFKFKYGLIILIEDQNMPSFVKQKISMADTSFKKGNLTFNLNDYSNPVSLAL